MQGGKSQLSPGGGKGHGAQELKVSTDTERPSMRARLPGQQGRAAEEGGPCPRGPVA